MFTDQTIRVTKKFTFDMAHALLGYDGPCKNIHGHTYVLSVTLKGKVIRQNNHPKNGMVLDFGDLKKKVKEHVIDIFDHSLVLNSESSQSLLTEIKNNFEKVNYVDYQPSCENLLLDFQKRISKILPDNLVLNNIKLEETPTSFAEWFAEDNN